ncbi:MAG: hypothetical protein KIT84_45000 [Labilithrix sp.]|nr:hypothetical protein [Labilithrix sp.]MCW5818241.1 hypothetical protein [Labilithrix sp.]
MDAVLGAWVVSILGAAAFAGAGYVLGLSKAPAPVPVAAPVESTPKKKKKKAGETPSAPSLPAAPAAAEAAEAAEAVTPVAPKVEDEVPPAPESQSAIKTVFPPPAETEPELPDDDGEDRPTLMPDVATHEAMVQSSVATIPPSPRAPSLQIDGFDHDATRAMIRDALAQVEHAAEQTRALEAVKVELERQAEAARNDLRNEVVLRAAAEARAEELSDRLVRASEEASSLRHRVNMLDRQAKLLRESLKGKGPIDDPRRRDEEAEEMRLKLRDVVQKLERASMPPPSQGGPPASNRTGTTLPPDSIPRAALATAGLPRSLVPMNDDTAILREEIARLAQENRALRAQTLGSFPPKKAGSAREDAPAEVDLDVYKLVIDRLTSIAGLKGVCLADEVGAVLLGNGELAENLAAFGAYIRDAGARTDRLLPLDGVEEVDIRDRNGMFLSTRVVLHDPSELAVVFLASADASLVAAKKVIDDTLWLKKG